LAGRDSRSSLRRQANPAFRGPMLISPTLGGVVLTKHQVARVGVPAVPLVHRCRPRSRLIASLEASASTKPGTTMNPPPTAKKPVMKPTTVPTAATTGIRYRLSRRSRRTEHQHPVTSDVRSDSWICCAYDFGRPIRVVEVAASRCPRRSRSRRASGAGGVVDRA
jgi:hypothetical protein